MNKVIGTLVNHEKKNKQTKKNTKTKQNKKQTQTFMEKIDVNSHPAPKWLFYPAALPDFSQLINPQFLEKPLFLVYHAFLNQLQVAEFVSGLNSCLRSYGKHNGLFAGEFEASVVQAQVPQFHNAVMFSVDFPETPVDVVSDQLHDVVHHRLPRISPKPDLVVLKIHRTTDTDQVVSKFHHTIRPNQLAESHLNFSNTVFLMVFCSSG
mmetsp:Transcript_4138/g.6408  ORF Transcript_4138/g.6408 Transcript_4138/m.6408 type:complete len:208 (+) Transcript_4138:1773-2396(+)